jgi:nucleoside 2-deoxyribosyltransferase
MKKSCYLASDLGFTESGRHWARAVLVPALEPLVEVVDPWNLLPASEIAEARAAGAESEIAARIGILNIEALDGCELLVALLDGLDVDSGTAAEIGYAAAQGKPCFGLRTDFRQSGEPGATVNLQVESFIAVSGGALAGSLEALIEELSLFGERT